jgi:two-component system, response regulator
VLLLVEDNPDDVALARRALVRSHIRTKLEIASSGDEALSFLQSATRRPKAIFMDLNMPGISGFDLLRRLRHDPSTRTLPVVVLTTSKDPVDIDRCYALGANSFVTKPVDFSEFTDLFVRVSSYWTNDNQTPA